MDEENTLNHQLVNIRRDRWINKWMYGLTNGEIYRKEEE